jgi:hypothetical protein
MHGLAVACGPGVFDEEPRLADTVGVASGASKTAEQVCNGQVTSCSFHSVHKALLLV